jgi:hypothetical protein
MIVEQSVKCELTGETEVLGENLLSATLSTTNPTWSDQGSNPGHRDRKSATNCLSYGTASGSLNVHTSPPLVSWHLLLCLSCSLTLLDFSAKSLYEYLSSSVHITYSFHHILLGSIALTMFEMYKLWSFSLWNSFCSVIFSSLRLNIHPQRLSSYISKLYSSLKARGPSFTPTINKWGNSLVYLILMTIAIATPADHNGHAV